MPAGSFWRTRGPDSDDCGDAGRNPDRGPPRTKKIRRASRYSSGSIGPSFADCSVSARSSSKRDT